MEMQEKIVRHRILEIGTAILYNVSEAPKPFSTGLISAVSYGNDGSLFFFASCPQFLVADDRRFPGVMVFFKKGNSFFITLNGTAELLSVNKDTSQVRSDRDTCIKPPPGAEKKALFRFQIDKIEYTDHSGPPAGFLKRIRTAVYSWF
jgi:hypothetical protein